MRTIQTVPVGAQCRLLTSRPAKLLLMGTYLMQRAARWRRRLRGLVGAGAGGATASECSGPEWTLALGAGQNDFSIVVSSASAVAQVRKCWLMRTI